MRSRPRAAYSIIFLFGMGLALSVTCLAASAQNLFATPQAGVNALVTAVKVDDEPALRAMFGPESSKLLNSGDPVEDAQSRKNFVDAYNEAHKIVLKRDTQATLVVGRDEWPLPIPLVKDHDGWRFDTVEGEDEILKRRIGRNELSSIQVCLAIVFAERVYATQPVYASRFRSTPGKHDGLYWPTQANEAPSLLGVLLADAANEGYSAPGVSHHRPYHGYLYRILTSQSESAPGGARDYMIKGKMIGGFAVIAYPADYGASGVKSFLISHNGVLYEKDLGPDTKDVAMSIMAFDPTGGWSKVKSEE
jgi:hypothetical protein